MTSIGQQHSTWTVCTPSNRCWSNSGLPSRALACALIRRQSVHWNIRANLLHNFPSFSGRHPSSPVSVTAARGPLPATHRGVRAGRAPRADSAAYLGDRRPVSGESVLLGRTGDPVGRRALLAGGRARLHLALKVCQVGLQLHVLCRESGEWAQNMTTIERQGEHNNKSDRTWIASDDSPWGQCRGIMPKRACQNLSIFPLCTPLYSTSNSWENGIFTKNYHILWKLTSDDLWCLIYIIDLREYNSKSGWWIGPPQSPQLG